MSIIRLRREVQSLIVHSGMQPNMKMRHDDLNATLTRNVIASAIKERS